MIDEALRAFLERGAATLVGTVSDDGEPHAQRGWGMSVVDPTTLRVLLDDSDRVLRSHLDGGGAIAVTAADVRTLRSVQLKGRVLAVEAPTDADLERCRQHIDELLDDIYETDHYPRDLTARMVPPGFLVGVVAVEELYDQTPGPTAGARMDAAG